MLYNINRVEKIRYFTLWDVPIWRSNIWTTHNSLYFHLFHSFLPQKMCEIYFGQFHVRSVTSFIHKMFIIIFEIHLPKGTLQCFQSQYVTWICCSEFQGNIFKAQPYSLKHMKISRIPLDHWSTQLKDLYLTTHNTHNRQISILLAEIQPTVPPNQKPQSHFLDCAASGVENVMGKRVKNIKFWKTP